MGKFKREHVIAVVVATVLSVSVTGVRAQEQKPHRDTKPKTAGNIDLELTSEKKKDPYLIAQENALNYLKNLKVQLSGMPTNNHKLLMPEAETINYLGGLYLFCSMKRGICPAVLESLFEVDLVNSKMSNVTLCPVMKSFWKRYIDNDFEDRLKYSVSTGFVSRVNDFNAKERPRFLRCEDTLKEIFKGGQSATELFTQRYHAGSRALKAVDETIALINAVQEKNTNVFIASGAQS